MSRGPVRHKWVALTFDDGPSTYTDDVLRILDHNHVHATFFQIGEQVPAYAALDRKILAHGNEIGNHSWRHAMGPGKSDLRQTSDVIEHATGFRPCMFRPPGGYLPSSTAAAASALAHGQRHLGRRHPRLDDAGERRRSTTSRRRAGAGRSC